MTTLPTITESLPTRTLGHWTAPRGVATTRHLEDLRDELQAQRDSENPRTIETPLAHMHLSFGGGARRAVLSQLTTNGLGNHHQITRNGLSQLAAEVLPRNGLNFLQELMDADKEKGRSLADVNAAVFMRAAGDTPRVLRVSDFDGVPTVRAVLSQKYTCYDDIHLVEDLLTSIDTRELPVLSYTRSDTGMRIRLATGEIKLHEQTPMIEAWNSEVGRRRVGLRAGTFRLICTNGMGSWDDSSEYGWQHLGGSFRIQSGIADAVGTLKLKASGAVEEYNRALNVAIDDAIAWMQSTLAPHLTDEQITRAQGMLFHETTTPGLTLASVVDAITLSAQDENDIFDQQQVERAGWRVLRAGVIDAARNGGKISVAA